MDIVKSITQIAGNRARTLRRSSINTAIDTIGPKSITKIAGDSARAFRRSSIKKMNASDTATDTIDPRLSSKTESQPELLDTIDADNGSNASKITSVADTTRKAKSSHSRSKISFTKETEQNGSRRSTTSGQSLDDAERDIENHRISLQTSSTLDTERISDRNLARAERDSRGSSQPSKTKDLVNTESDSNVSPISSKNRRVSDTTRSSASSVATRKSSVIAGRENSPAQDTWYGIEPITRVASGEDTSNVANLARAERDSRGSSQPSKTKDLVNTESDSNVSPISSKNRRVSDTTRSSASSVARYGMEPITRVASGEDTTNVANLTEIETHKSTNRYPSADSHNVITNGQSQSLSQSIPPSPTAKFPPAQGRIEPDMLVDMLLSLPPMIMPVPGPLLDPQPQQDSQSKRRPSPPPPPSALLLPVLPIYQSPVPNPLPQHILRCPRRSFTEQPINCTYNTDKFSPRPNRLSSRPDCPDYNDKRTHDPTVRRSCNMSSRKAIQRSKNSPSNDNCSQKKKTTNDCYEKKICRKLIKTMLRQEIIKNYKNDLRCCLWPKTLGACLTPTMCCSEPARPVTQTPEHDCCQEHQTSQYGSPSKDCRQRKDSQAARCQCTYQNGQSKRVSCSTMRKLANSFDHVPANVNVHCVHSSCICGVRDVVEEKQNKRYSDNFKKKDKTEDFKTIQFTISRKDNRFKSKPLCLNVDINQLCRLVSCQAEGNTLLCADGGDGGQLSKKCPQEQLCGIQKSSSDLTNTIVPTKKERRVCKDEQLAMGTVPRQEHEWTHSQDREKSSTKCPCQGQYQERTGTDQNVARESEESKQSRRTQTWNWSGPERDLVATKKYNFESCKSTILGSLLRSNKVNDLENKSKPSFNKRCRRAMERSSDPKYKCEEIENPFGRTGILPKALPPLKERYENPCSISNQSPDFTNMTKRLRMINDNIESTKNEIQNSLHGIIENRKKAHMSPTSLHAAKQTRNERFKIDTNETYDTICQKEREKLRTKGISRRQMSTLQFIESNFQKNNKKLHLQNFINPYNKCMNNSKARYYNEENTRLEEKGYITCRQTSKVEFENIVSKHVDEFLDKNESRFTPVLSIKCHEDENTDYLDSGGETSTNLDLSAPLVDKMSRNHLRASTYRECDYFPYISLTSSTLYFDQNVHEINIEDNALTADSIYEKGFCESDDHRINTASIKIRNSNRQSTEHENAYQNKEQLAEKSIISRMAKTEPAKKYKEEKDLSGKNTKELENKISQQSLPSLPLSSDSDTMYSDGYLMESKCNARPSDEHIEIQSAPGHAKPPHVNQLLETDSDISIDACEENYSNASQKPNNESCVPKNGHSQITKSNAVKDRYSSHKYPCVVCDKYCPEIKCPRICNSSITTTNSKISLSEESVKSKELYFVKSDHSSDSHESDASHDSRLSLSSHRDSFNTDESKQSLSQMKCKKSSDESHYPCQNPCGKSFKKSNIQSNKSQKQCIRSPYFRSQSACCAQSLDYNDEQESSNYNETMSLREGARCKKQKRSSVSGQCKISSKKCNQDKKNSQCPRHFEIKKTKATKSDGKYPHSATLEQHYDNLDCLKSEGRDEIICKEKHYNSFAYSSINPFHISPACCNDQKDGNSLKHCHSDTGNLLSWRNPNTNPKAECCGPPTTTNRGQWVDASAMRICRCCVFCPNRKGNIYQNVQRQIMERLINLETKIDHCCMKPPVNNFHQESCTCCGLVNDPLAQAQRVHCQDCRSSQTKQFQHYMNKIKCIPEIDKKAMKSTRCRKQPYSCSCSSLRNIEICKLQRTWNSDNTSRSAHSGYHEARESSSSSSFSCRCSSSECIADSLSLSNLNMESSKCTPSPILKRAHKVHYSKANDLFQSINQKCSAMRNTMLSSIAMIKSKAA